MILCANLCACVCVCVCVLRISHALLPLQHCLLPASHTHTHTHLHPSGRSPLIAKVCNRENQSTQSGNREGEEEERRDKGGKEVGSKRGY